ncbi:response regulator transcription factor [Hutsoniella sourekii]
MNIVIVDDDPIVVASLANIIELISQGEIKTIATGLTGREAVALYFDKHPDVILMDIQMPEMNGLEALDEIMKRDPSAKVVLLTTFLDDDYIIQALKLKAKGYLMKTSVNHIHEALYAVNIGGYVYGDEIISKIPTFFKEDKPLAIFQELNELQYQIVSLVADGMNNREIAQHLNLSEGTVRNYLSEILSILDIRDRTQLAIAYYKYQ